MKVMDIEILKDKVRKILSKTVANGATEAEAKLAVAKAQQLLASANLDIVDLDEEDYNSIIEEKIETDTKSLSLIQVSIALSLKEHFGVEILRTASSDGSSNLKVIGEKIKVQIYKETFCFVYNSFKSMWSAVVKSLDVSTKDKNRMRGGYLKGFCDGITNELIKQESETALVVVKSDNLVKYMENVKFSTYKYNSSCKSMDLYGRGYVDGSFSQRTKSKSLSN